MKANVFLVGAPKCGTSAMAHYLAMHPDIYMAKKEMHFFGKDLRFRPQFYRRDRNAYLAEFQARNGQRWAGEASVWYLLSASAADEIKSFNRDSRIIIMLREPAEMLHSLYHQFRFDGNEHLSTFEEALEAEDDRRAGRRLSRQTYLAQGLQYSETVRYARQVERYFNAFGRENVKVILYDDFAADVRDTYRETLDFLGLDVSRANTDFKIINPAKQARSRLLRAVLSEPSVRSFVLTMRPCIPRRLFAFLQNLEIWLWRSNTRPAPRLPLDPRLRAKLRAEFAPEVERLGELLGRDLSHWTTGQPRTAENISSTIQLSRLPSYSKPSNAWMIP
jgi:sulfotransferase family protein